MSDLPVAQTASQSISQPKSSREPESVSNMPSCLIPWEYTLSDGTTLRGQRTPPSGKPVIHFLHGNGFCGLTYWPMLSEWLNEYDLFLHDVQGHGDSDDGPLFYGWNGNAERAHQVWQAFESDYTAVTKIAVGHSFGGILSILMASKTPSPFDRLILLDPVIFTPRMCFMMQIFTFCRLAIPNPMAKRALARRHHWPSRQSAKDYLEGRGIFRGWDSEAFEAYMEFAMTHHDQDGSGLKCPPSRERDIFASAPKHLWRSIKAMTIPTDLLYGNKSYTFVRQSVRILERDQFPIHLHRMDGGHCFMQENPKNVANQVLKLLKEKKEPTL